MHVSDEDLENGRWKPWEVNEWRLKRKPQTYLEAVHQLQRAFYRLGMTILATMPFRRQITRLARDTPVLSPLLGATAQLPLPARLAVIFAVVYGPAYLLAWALGWMG